MINTRLTLNILAICGTAVFTGAMMNIGLSFVPYWQSLQPAEFLEWFSKNSHFIGRTIPLYLVPTLAGLIGSLWLDWSTPHRRTLWGIALLCIIGVLAITVAYHLPTNSQFIAKTVSLNQVSATLDMWLTLHTVRIVLGLVASVVAVLAVIPAQLHTGLSTH